MRVRDLKTKSTLSELVLHFARFHWETDWFIVNDHFCMVLFSAIEQMHCTLHVFISSNSSHWVISCLQNPPNSDMDHTVFTMHTSYYTWSACMYQYTHTGDLSFVITSEGFLQKSLHIIWPQSQRKLRMGTKPSTQINNYPCMHWLCSVVLKLLAFTTTVPAPCILSPH